MATAKSVVAFGSRFEFTSDPRSVIRRFLDGALRAIERDQVYVFAIAELWFTPGRPGRARRVFAYTFSFRGMRIVLDLANARRCIKVGSQVLGTEVCSWGEFRRLANACRDRHARLKAVRKAKRAAKGGLDLKYGALAKQLLRAEVRENTLRQFPARRRR